MPIEVAENWSAQTLSLVPPFVAYREWNVVGTENQDEACAAVEDAQRGAEHPRNAILTSEGPKVVRTLSPDHFHVGAQYTITDKEDFDGDPLQKMAELDWGQGQSTEPVDRDLDNRPILNSAGFRLPGLSRTYFYDTLTIMFFAPYYDHTLNARYRNAVNQNAMTVDGMQVAAQHILCKGIVPASPYNPGARHVAMRANFDVLFDDTLGTYPFQHRLMDVGDRGYWNDGGTRREGYFTTLSEGQYRSIGDVRLNGGGTPSQKVHPGVTVGEGKTPAAPIPQISTLATEYFDAAGTRTNAINDNTIAVFLIYKAVRVVDFSPLTTFLNQKLRRQS